jgi:rhamnosyltransferase
LTVTVALPVLNGEPHLHEVLAAVRAQRIDRPVELLVADSGSTDRSVAIAREHGAEVVAIPPGTFSHGGTRNLLMERASGDHVAFLTQDARPADADWLTQLLSCFELAPDVGLACGPYLARPGASHMVRRELRDFFASMAPGGEPRIDRLDGRPLPAHPGPVTFFTDANGCVARAAWEAVPFRDVPYAEDQMLARDMLAAGFAKAFHPGAAVVHSHDYAAVEQFRRCFDEWRGLREVYGHVEPARPRALVSRVAREVRADRRFLAEDGAPTWRGTLGSLRYHLVRAAGSVIGSRADLLPARLRRLCSIEGRDSFEPAPPSS